MAVPANEEVADGRKMSNRGKGGHDASYDFQVKKGNTMYDFTYRDFIYSGKQPKGNTMYRPLYLFPYTKFIADFSSGKQKGLRFDEEKMVRLLIFLLQGL